MASVHLSETRTWELTWAAARPRIEKKLQNTWADGLPIFELVNKFKETVGGGKRLEVDVEYAEGEQTESYTHMGLLNTDDEDVWTKAYYDWSYVHTPIVIPVTKLRQCEGDTQRRNFFKTKSAHAMATMKNGVAKMLHGPGTGNGSLDLLGLQALVPYNPTTGTRGGRNAANNTDWRNETTDVTNAYTKVSGVITIYKLCDDLRDMILLCTRDKEEKGAAPSVIYTTQTGVSYMEEMVQTSYRVVNKEFADLGIQCPHFRGVPILYSKMLESYLAGAGGETGHTAYVLNYKTLKWIVHSAVNFAVSQLRYLPYQDAMVARILLMAQLTINNPRYNGVCYGIDAPAIS